MRILFVSSRYYPSVGGVEEVVRNVAENLSNKNEITVLTSLVLEKLIPKELTGTKRKFIKLLYGFKLQTCEIDSTGQYKINRIWMSLPRSLIGYIIFPYRLLGSMYYLFKLNKSFKPQIINFHFPDDTSLYMWVLYKVIKVPLILNIHGNDLQVFGKKKLYRFLLDSLVVKAKYIIVNSEYMQKEFEKSYPDFVSKVVIIPNGIELSEFNEVNAKNYFNGPYLVFVGRMVYKKGLDVLLKAFAKIQDQNIKLLIEGAGEELAKNKKLASSLGLNDRVVFKDGKLNNDQKKAYMKASTIGIMPSRIEPFGIVALEMMALGLPIIASRTGGLITILRDNETCLFFENESVDELKGKIDYLLQNKLLREKLRENCLLEIKKYDNAEISKKYFDIFKSAKLSI